MSNILALCLLLVPLAEASESPTLPSEATTEAPDDLDAELVIGGGPGDAELPRWVEPPPSAPLELHAWAEAGYLIPVGEVAEHAGAYLSMARLQGRLHEDDFDAFIQVGADHGDLQLLDARIAWTPSRRVTVRAGRFKTPVSAEYLIPAPRLLFTQRSLHMAIVPRRNLGAEAEVHLGPQSADVALSAGVFDPAAYDLVHGSGELATARVLLHTASGFGAHAAAAKWLHRDGAIELLGEDAPGYDEHLVGALLFEEHGLTSVVEGALARTAGRDDDERGAIGGVASVAYRFPTGLGELDLEPAVAVETLVEDELATHCAQLALNFHPHDWNLTQTVEWEVHAIDEGLGHAVYLQLQAGL